MKTFLTFFIIAVLCGCGKAKREAVAEQTLPTATVRTQTVQSLKRMATEDVVGTVRPRLSASISAKVSGTIDAMLASPGQSVKAGQLLVEIDAREIQAQLEQAEAVSEQTQKDIKRFDALLKQSAVTPQEYDSVQSRYRVAQATASQAKTMLSYTKVAAPFAGIITAKHCDVGDLATPGKPLLELEDPTALRLEADVPDALIDKVKIGDKLTVRLSALNASFEGAVSEIAPAADPISRTLRVKLDLPSRDGLRSGQFGRVLVPVAEVDAIRVPASAVVIRGQMEIAFVVVDQHAQMRLVKTGKHLENEVEIVSGLSVGEPLVTEGAEQLRDGQPVHLTQ